MVSSLPTRKAAQVFLLPEILPEQTRILLDSHSRTALLLHLDCGEAAPLLYSFQLTPSAARIFLALLQTYPQYCPYPTLFAALYPAAQGESSQMWEQQVRPIRRALVALTPALRAFGLEAVALRGHGYVLASLSSAKDSAVSAPASRNASGQPPTDPSPCFCTKAGES